MTTCPECDAEVIVDDDDLEEMEIGDPWDCGACGSRLRVAGLDPIEFESDDEDDDDDEEEEASTSEDAEEDDDFEDDDEDDDSNGGGDWDE
jgi:hypothetical protein